MKRKDFLHGIGLASLASVLPKGSRAEEDKEDFGVYACTLTPSETAGPYPYPGTVPTDYTSSALYRSNIIGDLPTAGGGGSLTNVTYNSTTFPGLTTGSGIGLFLILTIQDTNCTPVEGARVDIWHCDKRGIYSAYNSTQNGGDQSSYTFLRGIQTTDSNGQVTFVSIFPSWYIPRAIHFHIQVYYNSSLALTTQLAIDDTLGVTVNGSTGYNRTYTFRNATDQVFSDGYSTQLVSFNSDSSNTRGYIGTATLHASITVLPLTLTGFTASVDKSNVNLAWQSANETNFSHFEIERATDGTTFTNIGSIVSTGSSSSKQYSFTDTLQSGTVYYRLKIVDKDGSFSYSKILPVDGKAFIEATLYPNPVKNKLTVLHINTTSNTTVTVLNVAGMILAQQKLPANITQTEFDVSAFAAGSYLLVIDNGKDKQVITFNKQ